MGWGYWGAYLFLSGYVTLGFGGYLSAVTGLPAPVGAVALTGACTALNLLGVKMAGRAQAAVVLVALGGLAGFAGLALLYGALAAGVMAVVAPVTAVTATVVPPPGVLSTARRPPRASTRSRAGSPKWKLTTAGRSITRTLSSSIRNCASAAFASATWPLCGGSKVPPRIPVTRAR